ncbi:MAG: hypothetical protein COY81_03755 [Candidatus Pacebacteria bacterium CG_4_10_14_0_8_um_filter_43_12]|nr:MAG: hypothetical protein COU66_00705 [Candidatus Pacebacteria bacterium CG10_big_fil_rev_8_21_14_0_10_44_11]PIY79199.1 MAG: hypothetical protein COY81_03755 [Candidatus Pacebacteria bacterium CG_4_10_14_0_8_um_filter_43_12]
MIGGLFLILAILASFSTLSRVFPKFSLSDKIAGALVISVIASTSLVFGLVALIGYDWGIALSLMILAMLSVFFLPKFKFSWQISKHSLGRMIFVGSWSLLFLWLFQHHFFPITANGWQTGVNSYGDLALHSTFIHYFAGQSKLSLVSPIYSQLQIQYPFLIDFHSAILLKLGWSIQWTLVVSSLLIMIGCLLSFFNFAWSINKKVLTPYLASLLFFLNGGLGWIYFFSDLKQSGENIFSFLTHLPADYAHLINRQLVWANVITTHVLPQRGFLLGLAVLVVVLRYWQALWQQNKIAKDQLVILSSLIGLLPFFHIHTFLILAPLHSWLSLWAIQARKINQKTVVTSLVIMLGLGGLLVWFLIPQPTGQNFFHWQPGWMATGNWLFFWLKNMNFEIFGLLLTPFLFWQFFPQKKFEQLLILPFISIFLLCNLFIFQPHDWDNMKFILLGWAGLSMLTGAIISRWVTNRLRAVMVGIVATIAVLAGGLSVLYSGQITWQMASNDDLKMAAIIVKKTKSDDRFLTSDIHNHPVPMIAGRGVVLGYKGWLWTHGIDYKGTEAEVKAIYAGTPTAVQLLKKYGVTYIFVGPTEREQFTVNEDFLNEHFKILLRNKLTTIYTVN